MQIKKPSKKPKNSPISPEREKKALPCPGVVKKLRLGYGLSTVKGEPKREKK